MARKTQKVLVVEDEAALQRSYRQFFETLPSEEFSAKIAPDGEQALAVLRREPVDMLVLDWTLPGISGPCLLKALRADARTRMIAILMVTAKGSPSDTVFALEAGADDYLVKPFHWNVLLARLRSLTRRSDWNVLSNVTRNFEGLELDFDAQRLKLHGKPVSLTPKELELLKTFLVKPNIVHAQSYLWDSVWGYDSEHWGRTLIVTLSSLRRKLGPIWGPRLKAQKRLGYILETS